MENGRILNDSGLDVKWVEAAKDMLTFGWALSDQAEHYSQTLISSVLCGNIGVEELRGGVAWVNALDHETVESGFNIEALGTEDRIEALSRRIAHNSGRLALKQVGSSRKRLTAEVRNKRFDRHK